MFADLVNKYGLVPKSAYPESANSKSSDAFKQYLNTKLREFASDCVTVMRLERRWMSCVR